MSASDNRSARKWKRLVLLSLRKLFQLRGVFLVDVTLLRIPLPLLDRASTFRLDSLYTSNTISILWYLVEYDLTLGRMSSLELSSNVFDLPGGWELTRADPSMMIASASGFVFDIKVSGQKHRRFQTIDYRQILITRNIYVSIPCTIAQVQNKNIPNFLYFGFKCKPA